jgi:pyruvate dehydrogenase E2 component (dihydrolipoamide acetyltransferase)
MAPGPEARLLARLAEGLDGRPIEWARALARDLGIDLTVVHGTGRDGVITRKDVETAAQGGATAATPGAPSAPLSAVPEGVRIPVRGVRKATAEKMSTSRREIPDAISWVDADATDLLALRDAMNAQQSDVHVTPLALILRACVAGLQVHRELNARWDGDAHEIELIGPVHLGFAAQTDRGLVVPVIENAHTMSTLTLAAELERLASAARSGVLAPADLTGSTFTVSNYGSFGVDGGPAIINYPEAAILGVGRIIDRPWVHDGDIAIRKLTQLSLSFDHRICDGAIAGGFLRFVADCVESPAALLGAL